MDPRDLRAAAAKTPSGFGPWSHEAFLLADIVDAVRVLLNVTVQAAGGTSNPPKPVRRPGLVDGPRRGLTRDGVAYLQRHRDAHRREAQKFKKESG